MKNLFTFFLIGTFVFLISCNDEDEGPDQDPLVGIWELDDASLSIGNSVYYGFEGDNNIIGESSYMIEFFEDFTYERELDDVPELGNFDDEGEWESDGEMLDLDSDDEELFGIGYSFDILEVTDRSMDLEFTETFTVFPDSKIDEWLGDGTLDGSGSFAYPDIPAGRDTTAYLEFYLDSLFAFQVQEEGVYLLEFDRQ